VSLTGLTQLGGALWALETARSALVQIDPATMELGNEVRLRSAVGQDVVGPTAAGGALWVAGQGVIARVDPERGRVAQRLRVSGQPGSLAVDHDTVFFVDPNANALRRVPVAGGHAQRVAYAAPQPGLLALIDARLYVTDDKFPSVTALDPGSAKRLGKVVLRRGAPANNQMADGIALTGIAAAGDALWLPDWDANRVYRVPVARLGV
jgi:sugar lactone lactonase YvrE